MDTGKEGRDRATQVCEKQGCDTQRTRLLRNSVRFLVIFVSPFLFILTGLPNRQTDRQKVRERERKREREEEKERDRVDRNPLTRRRSKRNCSDSFLRFSCLRLLDFRTAG